MWPQNNCLYVFRPTLEENEEKITNTQGFFFSFINFFSFNLPYVHSVNLGRYIEEMLIEEPDQHICDEKREI